METTLLIPKNFSLFFRGNCGNFQEKLYDFHDVIKGCIAVMQVSLRHPLRAMGEELSKTSNLKLLDAAIQTSKGMLAKIALDVTDTASIRFAIAKIHETESRIDLIVNNACDVVVGTIESCTLEQQIRSMDVNYFGVVRLLKEILPIMRNQRSGQIINLSSIAGIDPYPPIETSAVTKFALEGLTESLATNLRPWGIRCSLIEPGGVKTFAPERADQGKEILEKKSVQ